MSDQPEQQQQQQQQQVTVVEQTDEHQVVPDQKQEQQQQDQEQQPQQQLAQQDPQPKAEAFRVAIDRKAKQEAESRAHRIESRMFANERHATSGYGGQQPLQAAKKKRANKTKQSFAERIYAGKRLSPASIFVNDDGANHAVCLLRYSGPRPQASGSAGLRSFHVVCNSEFSNVDSTGGDLTAEQQREVVGERRTLTPSEATQDLSSNIAMLLRVCEDPQLQARCEKLTLQLGTVLVACGERSAMAFPVQDTRPFVQTYDLLREIETGHVRPFFVKDSPFFIRSAMRKVCYTQHYADIDGGCEAQIQLTHPDGVSDVFTFQVLFPTAANEHEFKEEDKRKKFVLVPVSVTRDNVNTWWLLHLIPKGYHRRFEKSADSEYSAQSTRSGVTVHGLDAAIHADFVRAHLSKDHPNVAKAAAALERILEHELGYQIQNSKSDVSWLLKNFAPSLSPAYPKPGPTQPELLHPDALKAQQMTEEERKAVAAEAAKSWKEQLERERQQALTNPSFDEKAAEEAEARVEQMLSAMQHQEDEEMMLGDDEDEANNRGADSGHQLLHFNQQHHSAIDAVSTVGSTATRHTSATKATVTSATLASIGKNVFSNILPDGSMRKTNNIYAYYSLDELFPRRGNIDDMIIVRASVCRRELFKKDSDSPFTIVFTRSTNYELASATSELHPANGMRLRITRVPDAIVRNEMRQCCVEYVPVDFFTQEQNAAVFAREAIHLAYDVATGLNRLCSLNNRDSRDAATFGRDIINARNLETGTLDNGMLTSTGVITKE